MNPCDFKMNKSVNFVSLIILFSIFLGTCSSASSSSSSPKSSSTLLAKCSSDSDCSSSTTFLQCSNQQCRCSAIMHFDEEMNKCLIRAGVSCEVRSKSKFCVAFSECKPSGKDSLKGTCECRPKHKQTIDNLCSSSMSTIVNHTSLLILSLFVSYIYHCY